jgi:aspartokinase/homoserine dehydrogenase 1
MKVLKFGGTSVGSAKNIKKVIEIVKSSSENDQIAVVVSAVGGITDKLMSASQKAIDNDLNYKNDFNKLKQQHHRCY